ncbi:NAD-dependent malic enzyme, mitochondrial, partial [Elasticomyces elasticus]
MSSYQDLSLADAGPRKISTSGRALLADQNFNKGTAFTSSERAIFGLHGLLPTNVQTLDQQAQRAYEQYSSYESDLLKNNFMTSMAEQNIVLYYKLIQDHMKEMFSIIYTPTEGDAIQNYSREFRRPEGCFLSIKHQDEIEERMSQFIKPGSQDGTNGVDYIVVSDGEQILGIGDQAKKLFPEAYIHFEDFGVTNARRILDRYRKQYAVFNDDVQGTGCVTLASIIAAAKASDVKLGDLRVLSFGAGSAGTGIAGQITAGIASDKRCSKEEAMKQIFLVDKQGLLLSNDESFLDQKDLKSIIAEVKPHVLIGTSTVSGAFTEDAVEEMHKHVKQPIIFPRSNPTRLHEAKPEDLLKWTDGQALIATGSPFPPVKYNGEEYTIAECNNSVCFPDAGSGRDCSSKGAPASKEKDSKKGLCPDVEQAREVSVKIAMGVLRQAAKEDLLGVENVPLDDEEELKQWIQTQMWKPEYK